MGHRASGEGSIGKRKDGTYYGAIRLDGKRQWVYGETRREVADKLKELRRKAEQGMSIDGSKITLGAFLNRWLEEVVKKKNKPKTYRSYKQSVAHILPSLGNVPIGSLRPDQLQALMNKLTESGKAPRTVRNVRAVLRKVSSDD